jgi:site-specific recombinase XerD
MIKKFEQWLNQRGYRLNTVRGFITETGLFFKWCETEALAPGAAAYSDVLAYINYCQANGNAKQTINQKLNSLRHFYNCCIHYQYRIDNPVAVLRIHNIMRKLPHDILSEEQLENIYKSYPATGITGKRNKAMLGLLIYQGITTAELARLETTDIKLEEGKIYVPSASRSNSRTLALKAPQIIQLQNYLMTIRPVLIALSEKQTAQLFLSTGKSKRISNTFLRMLRHMKKQNASVKDLKQVRASVITHWLKQSGIRQVQYMTGHKYVSSTERYRTDKLESLQEQLENLHPLQ